VLLSNHVNAASLVKVQTVVAAEIDSTTAANLHVDTLKEFGQEKRVRIKLFMPERYELKPEEQFNGRPLISHNVGIDCESDSPFLEARGEINYLEGFFCVLTHKKTDHRNVPATVRVSVSVKSQRKDGKPAASPYSHPMLQFDVQMLQKIVLPKASQINLSRNQNTASVELFSNVDFNVKTLDGLTKEVLNPYESPLKFSVQKNGEGKRGLNAYRLQLSVTMETEDRDWVMQIQHP